jgi:putative ABC transport system permease protein
LYGRFFAEGEDQQGAAEVVVLSEELWTRAFGADPKVVGATIRVNGEPAQIIGIARAGERYPLSGELFLTKRYTAREMSVDMRGARWLTLVGRVKDGVAIEQADRQVTQISEAMEKRFPEMYRQRRATAVQVHEFSFSDVKRPLYVMLAATGLVLLIACANVANLMLVRGTSREGELAIRTALGAGSGRLVRQLIAESLALTTLGALAGVGLARLGMMGVLQMAPPSLLLRATPSLDVRALALSGVVALLTAFVFGILPAAQIRRVELAHALRSGARGSRSTQTANRVRRMIIAAEVALAVVLLSGAGVLLRSFQRLTELDPGFKPEHVLVAKMVVPQQGYETPEKKLVFLRQLQQKLAAIPGAQQVGVTDFMPLDGGSMNNSFRVVGRAPVRPSDEPGAEWRRVTPEFLSTIGVPLLMGRMLNDDDHATSPWVIVVNDAFVKRIFPTEDPIGKVLDAGFGNPDDKMSTIVGVVGDVKHEGLVVDAEPTIYFPYAQHPVGRMQVAVRSAVPPASLSAAVRRAVKELDGTIPLFGVRPMVEVVSGSIGRQKFIAVLIGIFAAVALALAAVGLYGVIAYGVSQRTHELGVRVALGATTESVSGMIVREGLVVTGAGLVIGLGAALLSGGVLTSLLYEVKPSDPVTLAAVAAVLVLVAALASYLPARRAARVDPIIAMRGD